MTSSVAFGSSTSSSSWGRLALRVDSEILLGDSGTVIWSAILSHGLWSLQPLIRMAEETSILVGSWNCVAWIDLRSLTPLDQQSANLTSNLAPESPLFHDRVLDIPVRGKIYEQLEFSLLDSEIEIG